MKKLWTVAVYMAGDNASLCARHRGEFEKAFDAPAANVFTVSVPRVEARVPTHSRLACRGVRSHAPARAQEYAAEDRPPLQLRSLDSIALVALKQVRERSEKIRVESPSHSRRYRIRFER